MGVRDHSQEQAEDESPSAEPRCVSMRTHLTPTARMLTHGGSEPFCALTATDPVCYWSGELLEAGCQFYRFSFSCLLCCRTVRCCPKPMRFTQIITPASFHPTLTPSPLSIRPTP